ncbi:MAG: hypothetical protein LBC64_06525 [Fibromonadaceae bacterium]|jgi:hypothetical protein|nr:hypothetical protein [Fibromonadaceae bacterium]
MRALRFVIVLVAVFGSMAAFATDARVESMGKSARFIMDDMSIFDNPANINLYPNFLIGELGVYNGSRADSIKSGQNHDPWDPWFGGLFSLDIGGGVALSIGGVLGRKDERLLKYFPDFIRVPDKTNGYQDHETPIPVTNFDGFLGASFGNTATGLHIYVAHQGGITNDGRIAKEAFASALQLDGGVNIELSRDYQLEVAAGVARIQYGPSNHALFDSKLLSEFLNARFFYRINAIDGHLIPVVSVRNMHAPGRSEIDVNLGAGVDTKFERGFFWLGLTGFYNIQKAGENWFWDGIGPIDTAASMDEPGRGTYFRDLDDGGWGPGAKARLQQIGGIISFGIERNLWWDWFVMRVGGQKVIAYASYKKSDDIEFSVLCPSAPNGIVCDKDGSYFVTNPVNDGTTDDNVGFGFGVNIEEKLKVDFAVSEDFPFRNPFQGGGRLISKISATYSF